VQRLLPHASGSGRVLALEVMRVTRPIAAHIREGRDSQIPSAIQAGAADGMIPLERCLRDLVRDGKITRDVARACANDPQSLQAYLR
jgi:twitching motility protein PilT